MTTNSKTYAEVVNNLASPTMVVTNHHILHAAMGLASESGEILDQVKANAFYGKELDIVNLAEEAGDILFFTVLLLNQLGVSLDKVIAGNRAKLAERYGENFDSKGALFRDKEKEMKALKEAVWGGHESK